MEEGGQNVPSDGVGDEMEVERVPPVDTQSNIKWAHNSRALSVFKAALSSSQSKGQLLLKQKRNNKMILMLLLVFSGIKIYSYHGVCGLWICTTHKSTTSHYI